MMEFCYHCIPNIRRKIGFLLKNTHLTLISTRVKLRSEEYLDPQNCIKETKPEIHPKVIFSPSTLIGGVSSKLLTIKKVT